MPSPFLPNRGDEGGKLIAIAERRGLDFLSLHSLLCFTRHVVCAKDCRAYLLPDRHGGRECAAAHRGRLKLECGVSLLGGLAGEADTRARFLKILLHVVFTPDG